jgi:P-type Ca2+ transporter type 2C
MATTSLPGGVARAWAVEAAEAVVAIVAIQLAIVYLPALHPVFGTEPLAPVQLAVVMVASTTAFVAVESEKWLRRRRDPRGGGHGVPAAP